jgi:hypothetical protein
MSEGEQAGLGRRGDTLTARPPAAVTRPSSVLFL